MKIKKIKYDYILPLVIDAMFPEKSQKEKVIKRLKDYGKETWHIEPNRVQLAILKFTHNNTELFDQYVDTACEDYRDIIYLAETPLSFADWDLPINDPEKYNQLLKQDNYNYLKWIGELINK